MFPKDIISRIKLPFQKERKLYSALHQILGFYPIHIKYYEQALLHKSSSIKKAGAWINNERLEFLGDAILDAVVGDIVFRHFTGKKEGFLTNTRSKIVQRETLNKVAVEIGLDKLIISSTHNTTHNNYMCGNAFEALVGAIYLDRGYYYCMKFIQERILKNLINIDKVAYKEVNFKSKLIEWCQKNHVRITFELINQTTESQASPIFVSRVLLEDIPCDQGQGYSKKESQQIAAKETLQSLKQRPAFLEQILKRRDELTEANISEEDESDTLIPEDKETATKQISLNTEEFDLSDISMKTGKPTKEDIIAAAESAAYNDTQAAK